MRTYVCAITVVLTTLATAPGAFAQTAHTAPSSLLDAVVQEHVVASDADRQLVQRLLDRADVRAVAAGAGIDLQSASTAVGAMDAAALASVATQVRAAEPSLAGGQSTVTISTTAIIIGLLILILVLVAN